jgi:hypothetical protein
MNDGLLGFGYAHTLPPLPAAVKQWTEVWSPQCILEEKRGGRPLTVLRSIYYTRVGALLLARISWKAIHTGALDDPRVTEEEFQKRFALAIERRRCRLDRRKGKVREHYAG